MSGRVIPVELKTGIPYALEPSYDEPSDLRRIVGEYDLHHTFPRFKDGEVLQAARVQYVRYGEHREYHHHFDGYMANEWQLPVAKLSRFGMVVLLGAGYIPDQAIRLGTTGPAYVPLTEGERQFMRDRRLIRIETESIVYDFLRRVVLSQPLDIEDIAVQEFIFSKDEQLRMKRGDELLLLAAEAATEPVREHYREAYLGRLLLPGLPPEPHRCVFASPSMLGTLKRRRKARTCLRVGLATRAGVVLNDIG